MSQFLSLFSFSDRPQVVDVDPYGTNPVADELAALHPAEFAIAARVNGPPPKMFLAGSADLPAFTASGFDPSALLRLPYRVRHGVAAEPSIAIAGASFERFIADPFAHVDHEGLVNAVARLNEWLQVPDELMLPEEQDALYSIFYNAANAPKPPPPPLRR